MKKGIIITGLLIIISFSILQRIDSEKNYSEIVSSEVIEQNDDSIDLYIEEEILRIDYNDYWLAKILYTIRGIFLVLSVITLVAFLRYLFPLARKMFSEYLYISSLHYNLKKYRLREVVIFLVSIIVISFAQYYMSNRLEAFPGTKNIDHYVSNGICYVVTDKNTHKQLSSVEYYFFFYFFIYVYYIAFCTTVLGGYFLFYIRFVPWCIKRKNI